MLSVSWDQKLNPFVFGSLSGAAATVATAPLELVKTYRQCGIAGAAETKFVSFFNQIIQQSGVKGCFRGLGASLAGILPHNGLFFYIYEQSKNLCRENAFSESQAALASSFAGGAIANILTNPIWVIKSKMTVNPAEFPTITRSFKKIYAQQGFRGYFNGTGASVLGVFHIMVQFPLYEHLKQLRLLHNDSENWKNIGVASVVSKLVATTFTYPLEVVRTQMQVNSSVGWKAAVQTYKSMTSAGIQGCYRGFQTNSLKAVSFTFISLAMFEELKKTLN